MVNAETVGQVLLTLLAVMSILAVVAGIAFPIVRREERGGNASSKTPDEDDAGQMLCGE
jgi:Tfp pilus assembly protein FimT